MTVEDRPDWMAAYMDHLGVVPPHGSGWRKLRCPFHPDSHASATLNSDVGAFKCFGCDAQGTAINLIIMHEGVDYRGAIRFVKEILGCATQPVGDDAGGGQLSNRQGAHRSGKKYVPARSRTWGDIG